MKYAPQVYARALGEIASEKLPAEKEKKIIANFLELVRKNGDWRNLGKIIRQSEKELAARTGRKRILIETARPAGKEIKALEKKIAGRDDILEYKINPDLVAGARVTIDDHEQFDASLRRKLETMFRKN